MDPEAPRDADNDATLREIVEKREICFDAFREEVGFQNTGAAAIGYELVLSGIHSPDSHAPLPGCDLCRDVYEDLKKVAEWILPREHRRSLYEIEPYEPIIRTTRKRSFRPEVSLSVRILHRDHYEAPIDRCETRCLVEMKKNLKSLGACEGQWKPLELRGNPHD